MMCGEFKGKMTELVNQKKLQGAMDLGIILWMTSAMNSIGFKILKFLFSA